jgi:hypothetical protein
MYLEALILFSKYGQEEEGARTMPLLHGHCFVKRKRRGLVSDNQTYDASTHVGVLYN